jgi:branched-subunit amino acid ABC-type transport system permease component
MLGVLTFAILGSAAGALIALLGLGVNVIFRASRVINFSHAAIAITAAYSYSTFLTFAPAPLALLLAICVGMAIGALTDILIMRPLRDASGLTKAIATIGILLTLQAILNLRYGYNPIIVRSLLLPSNPIRIGDITVGLDRIIIFFGALVVTAALYLIYKRTSFGIATICPMRRANAD